MIQFCVLVPAHFHIPIPWATLPPQGGLGKNYAARGTRSSPAVLTHSRRAPGGPEAAELTAGRCSITPEPTFPSVIHEIAESLALSMSENFVRDRRNAELRAKRKAERMAEMQADLIRMYEECKQAGVVVEVAAEENFSRITSVDVIRPVLSSKSGASTTPSSPLRAQEVLAQRIAAMHRSKNAADLGDRRQPDSDPAELRKGEGEIENTRLSMVSLRDLLQGRDDCCGHTPRPRSFVMVDHRKKQKGLAGLFGWLKGACHRASMLIPRTCARA